MSDPVVTRTICGLWMVEGIDLLDTTNFSWSTKVIDEPGDVENVVAEQFVRQELMAQISQQEDERTLRVVSPQGFMYPSDVWLGPQHDGYVEREQYRLLRDADTSGDAHFGQRDMLSLADPLVPDPLVNREATVGPDDMYPFTVCGIMLANRKPVCWSTITSNPLMAYFVVWDRMQQRTGDHMLLCAVHPGDVPAI